jgi:hypothetical protein
VKVRNSLAVCFIAFNLFFLVPASYAQDGLTAEVYDVVGQNSSPVLPEGAIPVLVTQVDNVDFNWGSGDILDSGLREDVIVKLTGNFTPISTGTTYITAPADDGVKLYLDGVLYIDDWYDKGGGGSTADVPTTEGLPMVIEMWYYENGGGANVKLMWFTDNGWEVIPASAFIEPIAPSPTPEPESVEPEPTPVESEPSPESSPTLTTEPSTNEALPSPTPSPTLTPNPSPTETTPLPTPLPVAVEPTPVVVPQPSPEPVIPPVYIPEPEIIETPIEEPETQPLPTPELEPEPELEPVPVEPEPTPEPIEPEPIQPEPPVEETEESIVQVDDVDLETLAPDTPVELSNGVVITAEQAIAVQLLQDPGALLQELFTNPAAAFAALGSVGADMTEEEREKSEKVIIAAVIAGNIATTAATSAAGAAALRRKP